MKLRPGNRENTSVPRKKGDSGKKALRFTLSAVGFTVDSAAFTISAFFKVILSILLIFVLTGLIFSLIFAYYIKSCLTPTLDISLEDYKLSEASTIYYQDTAGTWQELCTIAGAQNRVWVDYDQIPQDMIHAVVAIEDKRFYEHKGVDWYRTSGAFVKMFATMQTNFGGSTITQQLIKNLTGQDEVTVTRKLAEIFSALELEKNYDKEEILEWYLNAVYFGEGAYGVQTAAQTYFGKDVQELTLAQCACIVGITNQPTAYDPFYDEAKNKSRQETILREMYEQGYIDHATYLEAVNEDISSTFVRSANVTYSQDIYSYYEEVVIEDVISDLMNAKGVSYDTAQRLLYNGGYRIYCCLDPEIQSSIDTIYTNINNIPHARNTNQQLQSAIVVMDPYTGKILGLSGGVGEKTINFGLNRATETTRSAGSSIKPVASYGPAVELGLITPTTLVNDASYLHLTGTDWFPSNDGGGNYGVVTIYKALTLSLNTVAAQIIDKLPEGPTTAYNWLIDKLGFTHLVSDDCSYAPMALGQFTYGVTVREMTQAYCAFVNDGTFTYSRTYTEVRDASGNIVLDNPARTIEAFSPNTAHTMTYMMQSAVETGTGTEAYLGSVAVAGKTGTSTEYKDRWFVGCTPYYVAAVWTGFDMPARINTTGSNPAAQIWKKVMRPIHDGLSYKSFNYPYIGENTGIFGIVEEEPVVDYSYSGNDYSGGNYDYGGDFGGGDGSTIILG